MAPVVLAAQVLEIFLKEGPHLNDASSHSLDFSEPLLVEVWIVQDF